MNEDALLADPPLFVVADGMGGHAAGDVASGIAIDAFVNLLGHGPISGQGAVDAIMAANSAILHAAWENPQNSGMGTTLCGLASVRAGGSEHWLAFNVGDSRVYRLSGGRLTQLTVDHSEVEEMVAAGQLTRDQARGYRRRNVVTRSLGTDPAPEADSWMFPPTDGERFLVCSDGLTTEVTDDQIANCLLSNVDPKAAATELVHLALQAGGRDNITVIVVDGIGGDRPSDVDDDTTPGAKMSKDPIVAPQVTYQSGNWMAIAGQTAWLLVDSAIGDPVVSDAWDALRQHDGLDAIQRVLRDRRGRSSRSFGLVTQSGDTVILLLSGTAVAEVDTGRSSNRLACPAGASVAEYRLAADTGSLTISGGESTDDEWLPILAAVARASTLVLEWTADAGTEADVAVVEQAGAPKRNSAESVSERSEVDGGHQESAVVAVEHLVVADARAMPMPDPQLESSSVDRLDAGTIRDTSARGATIPAALNPDLLKAQETAEPAPSSPGEPDVGGSYDFLFGRTQAHSVEEAAVRESPPEGSAEAVSPTPAVAAVPSPTREVKFPQSPPLSPPTTVTRAATSGLIDVVPWVSSGNDAEVPASPGIATEGEQAEFTVSRVVHRSALDRMIETGSPAPVGPSVHAVRCPSQHPNPAHAESCRICGAAVSDQAVVTVPRPVLGRLRLSTGDEVTLDRGVLMGRRPAEDRRLNGERPHLVRLQSSDQGVSRNHVEVRLDGWHVLVVDLDSTNGTLITRSGQPSERLRPHQPTMIEPGTVVTLADDITFIYDATV